MTQKRKKSLKGVVFNIKKNEWLAVIKIKGFDIALGYYPTEEEAHFVYLTARRLKNKIQRYNRRKDD